MADNRRMSWGDMAEEELGTEILPGQVLGWTKPEQSTETTLNTDSSTTDDTAGGGLRNTEDVDDNAAEDIPSGVETPRSHFSDSSSEGEEEFGHAEGGPDSPPPDLNHIFYEHLVPAEPAENRIDEDTPMPDAPPLPSQDFSDEALENDGDIEEDVEEEGGIDPRILTAYELVPYSAMTKDNAMLPFSGLGAGNDSSVKRNYFGFLRSGRESYQPDYALHEAAEENAFVVPEHQKDRRESRRERENRDKSEPSLFAANADDKAKIRRLTHHQDLTRKEVKRLHNKNEETREMLKESRNNLRGAHDFVNELQVRNEHLGSEVVAWKRAFEKQKPIVALSKRWLEEKVDAGIQTEDHNSLASSTGVSSGGAYQDAETQTSGTVVRDITPAVELSHRGSQTEDSEDVSLSFAPLHYLELLPSSLPVGSRRSHQTSTNCQSFKSLYDDKDRLQRERDNFKASSDSMQATVRELERKHAELEQANEALRAQVDEELAKANDELRTHIVEEQRDGLANPEQSPDVSAADLGQFTQGGQELQAAWDRYQNDLATVQQTLDQLTIDHAEALAETNALRSELATTEGKAASDRAKLLACTRNVRAQLVATEEHRDNLTNERAKVEVERSELEVKYSRMREWAKTSQGGQSGACLPSPCTPLGSQQLPAMPSQPTAKPKRRSTADSQTMASTFDTRSEALVRRTAAPRSGIRLQAELSLQGLEGFLWFLCFVVLMFMLKSTPSLLNDWLVPKH